MNAQEITAFDYENQVWVTGPAAVTLRRAQLTADLALLNGPKGAKYLEFTGSKFTLAEAVAAVNAKLAELPAEAVAPVAAPVSLQASADVGRLVSDLDRAKARIAILEAALIRGIESAQLDGWSEQPGSAIAQFRAALGR